MALSILNHRQNVLDAPLRPVRFFSPEVELSRRPDGSLLMRSLEPLADYNDRIGDWLDHWALHAPDRTFLVEQTRDGERSITYRETYKAALVLAEGLLGCELGPDRPLAILARNSIDHAVVMLAALYVGIPIAPIAPAYALQTTDYGRLTHAFRLLTPGMIVVEDGELYARAMEQTVGASVPIFAMRAASAAAHMRELSSLRSDSSRQKAVKTAASRVGRETIAKFLFTSGSTGIPKAVINTHGVICSNSQVKRQVAPFLTEEPPVMVDWAPWNHAAGANSNFSLILHNGGTLYIDPGKPTPGLFEASLKLLRRVSPTLYFNVPRGYELLIPHLTADRAFSEHFFRRVKFFWYAAASMQPATWFELERLAVEAVGHRILTVSGLGMTETGPIALFGNVHASGPGVVGIPAAGVELKLMPHDNSFEVRYRGPGITPGYWRDSKATAAAFDAEGFLVSGDLVTFVDPERPRAGLRFEGRINEDFKLSSGTKVGAGKVRLDALDALRPLVNEVVVCGADRDDVRILVFPDWEVCALTAGLDRTATPAQIASSGPLRAIFQERLARLYAAGTGSSNRIVAALLVEGAPSSAAGELTEKGTVNSRALQRNRPELIEALFGELGERVLRIKAGDARS
jgi:feruloyl-CoA synthase